MRSSLLRRSHMEALKRLVLKRPRPLRLASVAMKGLLARFDGSLGFRPAPILATVIATRRCNLKCSFCNAVSKDGRAAGDQTRLLPLVADLADARVDAVGFTGGEPLLHEEIEEAIGLASERGMVTHLNTNGTLLTEERALRLCTLGLDSINISIDGACEGLHDDIRGPGSFQRALAGADALIHQREAVGSGVRVRFVMALSERNIAEAHGLLLLGEEKGVDGCSFLPVHPSGSAERGMAPAAAGLLDRAASPLLDNSQAYLDGIRDFLDGKSMPTRCSAPRTSIVIDPEDRIYPCVPAAATEGEADSWQPGNLMEVFKSPKFKTQPAASLCSNCWWNCHRELDITLGIL